MVKNILNCLVLSLMVFLFSGCASSRGVLTLDVPQATMGTANGRQVFIRSVVDSRIFEEHPKTPDVPSLSREGSNGATKETKSRAIARKRNGFGAAMGDVLLDEQQSVETVTTQLLKSALNTLGYSVTSNKDEAKPDAIVVDASIDKFWGWQNNGMWTLRLDTAIKTTLNVTLPAGKTTITIESLSQNHCQAADTANWRKVMRMVLDTYVAEATAKLKDLEKASNG